MRNSIQAVSVAAAVGVVAACAGIASADAQFYTGLTAGPAHGGIFSFRWLGGDPVVADQSGNFQTFCMEITETIYLNSTYYGSIDADVIHGGQGGSSVPLAPSTAYLYSRFRAGTLPNFDGSAFDQDAVQVAIWQDQGQAPALIENELNSAGYSAAQKATLYAMSNTFNALMPGTWSGIGNVRVANLYSGTPGNRGTELQSELVLIPVPLPTGAGMAVAGLLGIAGVRRRRD